MPVEGVQVVVAGGCDYYTGSASASPSFSFAVSDLRVAGEGDLLARIDRLRKLLDAEGLPGASAALTPVRSCHEPSVSLTGEGGKARDDVLAALARRGWVGPASSGASPRPKTTTRPPRSDAHYRIWQLLGGVDVVIVARGGGSLADLLCFCDETLCRTVALLAVPVIASVGHHTDRTLLDDVAAVSCSTPTHAAEAAVGGATATAARGAELAPGRRLLTGSDHGRRAVLGRARTLASLTRAPAEQVARHRAGLHQQLREMRAAGRRRIASEHERTTRRALVLERKAAAAAVDCRGRRTLELERLALALAAHDPQRTLERGYALVQAPSGEPIASAAAARAQSAVRLRFADDTVAAEIAEQA